jgi:hypothetical protein
MNLLQATKLSLILNVLGIGFPVFLYVYRGGLNFQIKEVLAYACLCTLVMYFWNKNISKINPLISILEKPETVVDGSPVERKMIFVVMSLPVAFGVISIFAIGFNDNGLKQVTWMIMAMAVNIGIHLEALVRLKDR